MQKFQIRKAGTIVDRNLTYEQALLWVDNSVTQGYIMEPMKESDQNVDNSDYL